MNSTDTKQIRKFGLTTFVVFGCLCALGLWKSKPFPTYFFGLLGILGISFILVPSRSSPAYNAWLKIAHFLGKIITTLILTLAYYLVITPSGLIKRLFGGSPLPLKPNKKTSSYWVPRPESAQSKERFLKRY